MNHITTIIPQKVAKHGELVVLPRKQYDLLVRAAQARTRPAQQKILNADLRDALEEVRQGKAIGPFGTARELIKSLRKSAPRR